MANGIVIVFCTFPDVPTAGKVVRELVEQRLIACGNIIPQIQSVYRWHNEVESNEEALAMLKLPVEHYPAVEQKVRELHPYEVPEIIAVPVGKGLPGYLNWVSESCP